MTTDRPKLYPGHRHQWADDLLLPNRDLVTCTVCALEMPRKTVEALDTVRAAIAEARAEVAEAQHLDPEQETPT